MYKFKKLFILILFMIAIITGISLNAKKMDIKTYSLPLATASPEDTVTQIYAEAFSKEVYNLSQGKMKIQIYPNSTLGGDRELLESCASGDIPFVIQNTAPQVGFMNKLSIFDLPCAFDDIEKARLTVDSPDFLNKIEVVYEDAGYKLLGYADQGFRVLSTNKKITSLTDYKGLKIRTMENPNHIKFWTSLSANPTPMSFNEVYIGLQQGTIDAQENPYEVIVSSKLYEQQKYVIETNHLPHFISLIVNLDFYNDLSSQEKLIIDKASYTAKLYARKASDDRINEKIDVIKNSGTEIVPLPKEIQVDMKNNSKHIYSEIQTQVGNAIYDAYLKQPTA